MSNQISIVPWDEKYSQDYISLSMDWLEKYVSVEPADIDILYHPYDKVLHPGGMIFFAIDHDKAIGTVSLIPVDDHTIELAKLTVKEEYRGQHIGNMLMEKAIQYVKKRNIPQILLYTNRKLLPAIHLYEKYGFQEVSFDNNKYIESDMAMILKLK